MCKGMNKIRTIIADDEPLARRGVRQLLTPHGDIDVVAEVKNGQEVVRALSEHTIDLLFLDIRMPELNGFEVLHAVGENSVPAVIFVTAYDEFAVRAFEAHALDYLVKPLEEARFERTLERVREHLRLALTVNLSQELSAKLATYELERSRRKLLVPKLKGGLVVEEADIDWIEADDYYAVVHTSGGRHLLRESLASLERRLHTSRFARTHRSAIVNLDHIREWLIEGGDVWLVVRSGMRVPVSRRRRSQVIRLLQARGIGF